MAIELKPIRTKADHKSALAEVERLERADSGYEILLREGTVPASAARRIVPAVPPARTEFARPRPEHVSIQIVGAAGSEAAASGLRADIQAVSDRAVTA